MLEPRRCTPPRPRLLSAFATRGGRWQCLTAVPSFKGALRQSVPSRRFPPLLAPMSARYAASRTCTYDGGFGPCACLRSFSHLHFFASNAVHTGLHEGLESLALIFAAILGDMPHDRRGPPPPFPFPVILAPPERAKPRTWEPPSQSAPPALERAAGRASALVSTAAPAGWVLQSRYWIYSVGCSRIGASAGRRQLRRRERTGTSVTDA